MSNIKTETLDRYSESIKQIKVFEKLLSEIKVYDRNIPRLYITRDSFTFKIVDRHGSEYALQFPEAMSKIKLNEGDTDNIMKIILSAIEQQLTNERTLAKKQLNQEFIGEE